MTPASDGSIGAIDPPALCVRVAAFAAATRDNGRGTTMMIDGGEKRVRLRRAAPNSWTKAVRAQFLDVLAATCNVRAACRAVGRSNTGARNLRRRDGAFALLWAEAIEQGTERLREELTARALGQLAVDDDNPDGVRAEPAGIEFDPQLAFRVLQAQAGWQRAVRAAPPGPLAVKTGLLKRLEALADRLDAR